MSGRAAIVRLWGLAGAFCSLLALGTVAKASDGEAPDMHIVQPEIEARIDALLATLTLEQKVAQMIQPEIRYVTVEDMRRYGFGSILNGGGAFPDMDKHASVDDWLALADAFYEASVDRSLGSAGIPTFWGTDAVHGHNNVFGATLFPHNINLGAARNPELLEAIAGATALEVRATGIDWIFAPTLAVVKDPRWGRTYEGYASQPELVAEYAPYAVRGLQSQQTAASVKHYLGDGGTWRGIDQGDTRLPLEALLREHGPGYRAAIGAGVLTVMASFNSWNGSKVHGNRQLLTDVLKTEWGFDGLVVSDWNGIGQVQYCSNSNCAQAINAGIDLVMVPKDWEPLYHNLIAQVRRGDISAARIDDAVRRILRVKFRLGLFDGLRPSQRAAQLPADTLGSAAHRALAAQAVRESAVLLKNNDGVLPLRGGTRILVAGNGADNIGQQSGGWTLTWQGTGNSNADFPGASSILDGIRREGQARGSTVVFDVEGRFDQRPDVAVVVFGETPYAEGQGDVDHLNHSARFPADLALLRRLHEQGVPVVAVLLTGRPLWVNAELNASDAFVVAWLPGSEGAALAEVLFAQPGSANDFRGRLPMPWPATDVNVEDPDLPVDQLLFPFGYGLTLASEQRVADTLNEVPDAEEAPPEVALFDRRSQPPWVLMLADERGPSLVTAAVAESGAGRVRIEAVDHRVQEDARRVEWRGEGEGEVYWTHSGDEVWDLLERLEGELVLALELQVEHAPTESFLLGVAGDDGREASVDIRAALTTAARDSWTSLVLPFACLEAQGMDFSRTTVALSLRTAGEAALTFADVRYRLRREDDALLCCSPDADGAPPVDR